MKKLFCLLCLLFVCVFVSCSDNSNVITVGASVVPHAQILNECKEYVKSFGYKLKIVEYTDYILPNKAVSDGSLDANFFQHKAYLDDYNESNKTDLVEVLKVHYEPLGLYNGKKEGIDNINNSTIAIPNDPTNCARALFLLKELGLIELDESKGIKVTSKDIIKNNANLTITEIEAAQIPLQLDSFDYGVINGNYALSGNVISKLIKAEGKESLGPTIYANLLVVQKGNEENDKIKILVEALSQERIREFIKREYKDVVIPII